MTERKSTYIRKIAIDTFEYGFVVYAEKFRKQMDVYTPMGTTASVGQAEAARRALESAEEVK